MNQTASPVSDELQTIAQEAYVFLYPLILMDITRRQMINSDPRVRPIGGPANAFTASTRNRTGSQRRRAASSD